jgi:hypothetical protein
LVAAPWGGVLRYVANVREIKVKGKEARFQKNDRGKFAGAAM